MGRNFALRSLCDFALSWLDFYNETLDSSILYKVSISFDIFNLRDREKLTITRHPVQKLPSMSIMLKHSKSHLPSPPTIASVDIFDEVLKWLEMIKCTEIKTRAISYGVIFTGLYHNIRFEFNIYVNSQGRLNHKTKQNPVWHKPVIPPHMLRDAIDEVVQWVKAST